MWKIMKMLNKMFIIYCFAESLGFLFIIIFLLSLFSNSITELCGPLHLPEIKLLDVSKNSVESISPDFLSGCPKLEAFNVSVNKICEFYQLIIRSELCRSCAFHFNPTLSLENIQASCDSK